MTETKKILLIGRSGRGKSTLANVLLNKNNNFEEVFKESSGSISETKKIQFEQFEDKDVNYLVIDTPGIGDTKMSDNEVLDIIAEAVYLAKDGLSQVLFVVGGRFDQSEMATYNLLRTIIFDENITEHTTIARTRFADFRKKEKRQADIDLMLKESQAKKDELKKKIADNEKKIESLSSESEEYKKIVAETEQLNKELKSTLSEIIESCQGRIVHVDNQPKVRIRKQSRTKLLEHLDKTCQTDYKPEKLKELSNAITEDMDKLLQSRKELEKEMEKLKTSQSSSANVQSSEVNKLENISETDKKTESVDEKESAKHEQGSKTESDNLAVGERAKELEDKKARLKQEIAEKEKVIRQKVLKHIFNNYKEISGELGGDVLMESVVGKHKWENISLEFKNKELVLKWLNEKFDYEQVQKWATALGDSFNPNQDVLFCVWLRDEEKLVVEKIEELSHIFDIKRLREKYVGQLEEETKILDKHNRQLSTQEDDWKSIHPHFTLELQKEWESRGFDYQMVKEWIDIGLQSFEFAFISWLRDEKNLTPQEVQQQDALEYLRKEYQKLWTDIHKDFFKKKLHEKTYQQLWEEQGLTYQDAQEWIVVGFEPSDHWEVREWKSHNFTLQETKSWIEIGLNRNDAEFATYLRENGYQPNTDLNIKQLRSEFNNPLVAQEWLEKYFPKEKRESTTKLVLNKKNLQGSLDLSDFVNLEELNCQYNELTSLNLDNCRKLKKISCGSNKLAELKINHLSELTGLDCHSNQLTNLDLSNSNKLIDLRINDNNFVQDLSFLSHLVNLKELYLGDNCFYGSLESLKNLTKLRELDIRNTDIDSGVEYLPDDIEKIDCSSKERPESKVKKIEQYLKLLDNKSQKEWENRGFSYEEVKEWMEAGLSSKDYGCAQWLKDIKKLTPEWLLNYDNKQELKEAYADYEKEKKLELRKKELESMEVEITERLKRLVENETIAIEQRNESEKIGAQLELQIRNIEERRSVLLRDLASSNSSKTLDSTGPLSNELEELEKSQEKTKAKVISIQKMIEELEAKIKVYKVDYESLISQKKVIQDDLNSIQTKKELMQKQQLEAQVEQKVLRKKGFSFNK